MRLGSVPGLVLAACVAVTACTPTYSRMQPFRCDAKAQDELAVRAKRICSCLRGGTRLPPHAFTTDGCSMSPDGNWGSCCVDHDIAYWCGGSTAERRDADARLSACIVGKGQSRRFGNFVRFVVRAGGAPWEPFPWRWAYGWSGIHGYEKSDASSNAAACFAAFP